MGRLADVRWPLDYPLLPVMTKEGVADTNARDLGISISNG
jgi:hypothetical protein